MALESVTHISDLVVTNPTATDGLSQGDDHIRNIKSALKTDFPNINGVVSATDEQLSALGADQANYIKRTGSVAFTANQPMGSFKLTGLANGSAATDSAAFGQIATAVTALNATEVEVETGTADDKFVTPLDLKNADLNRVGGTLFTGGINYGPWTNKASAATCDLGTSTETNLQITGTTTITSFGTATAGLFKRLRFTGAAAITFSANIKGIGLNTGTYTFDGNGEEIIECHSLGAGVWLIGFQFLPAAATSAMQGAASTNLAVTPANIKHSPSALKAMCVFDGSVVGPAAPTIGVNVSTVERIATGRYRITFTNAFSSATSY